MLRSYFLTAWRNLRRNKIFSGITIIGLSIGISASLVIYLIVSYDLSFDRSHKDGDHIYRVVTDLVFAGEPVYNGGVPGPMPEAVRKDLAGIDIVAPIFTVYEEKVSIPATGKKEVTPFKKQDHIVFADENYFKLIQYDWLAGSPATSLSRIGSVVLTASRAGLYFPNLPPEAIMGRRIYFDDTVSAIITGVVKDLPYHSDFTFKTFISRVTLERTALRPSYWDLWGATSSASQLLIKLAKGSSPAQMETSLAALLIKYNGQPDPHSGQKTIYRLQPLSDFHFNYKYGNLFVGDPLADKPTLYSLLSVAALLLILGCINFINLTTAQSLRRAKEIGIRKTIGSSRRQLIVQFLSETFVLVLLAMFLSIMLIPFLLKAFADFIPEAVHFSMVAQPGVLIFSCLLLIVISLLSGIYPATILSSYNPALVLKNQLHAGSGQSRRAWMKKTLTVTQFVIAQVFIMGTLLVTKQISYTLHKDLGFKKDAIVYFTTGFTREGALRSVLINRLKALSGIEKVSLSNDIPSSVRTWSNTMKYHDGKNVIVTDVELKYADTNYCRLYQIKLLAGTGLPYSDTIRGILINETYMHILGFRDPRDVIAKTVDWDNNKQVSIVGVVADFHQKSLHSTIQPLAITSDLSQERMISVSLAPQNATGNSLKTVIGGMRKAWSEVYPEDAFDYQFEDETLANYYKTEQNVALLLSWATGLAIFISCMGLLGLVIYTTNQRTKEIGIRKIVGASAMQIVALLSADFLRLIGWAFLIAVPVAWWGAHVWLGNFAYRTDLSWWIFLAGGLLMGAIGFIILFLRTFKAAMTNPANSLRTE